ncbi:MAG TPA: hypothetical protein VHK02_16410 [Actinomycetota bacterium]|nr:hypothetical protein [Actinomycetota bacterium]
MDPNGARRKYFVLTYDSTTNQVLSLSGHAHDFTSAVLTLTTRMQQHKGEPTVTVRLLTAADLPDLMKKHGELFEGLDVPED